MKNSYTHKEACDNCSYLNVFGIPIGVTVNDFMENRKCNNCGCNIRAITKRLPYCMDERKNMMQCGGKPVTIVGIDITPVVRSKPNRPEQLPGWF